jgi:hypothetical protein
MEIIESFLLWVWGCEVSSCGFQVLPAKAGDSYFDFVFLQNDKTVTENYFLTENKEDTEWDCFAIVDCFATKKVRHEAFGT